MRPDWLTDRPIAHRGWHDAAAGRLENTLGAAEAAMTRGFGIECDVQLSADGEAVVFHDERLERLTEGRGEVGALDVATLKALPLRASAEHIPTLPDLLRRIGGRVPLVCEIKSRFDGDMRLTDRVAALAAEYPGPLALKSFDPSPIARLRSAGCALPLGIVAEAGYDDPYFHAMSAEQKRSCAAWLHVEETRPDFLSWHVNDLPHAVPSLLRFAGLPILVWTVRTDAQKALARRFADQIVFEGEPD